MDYVVCFRSFHFNCLTTHNLFVLQCFWPQISFISEEEFINSRKCTPLPLSSRVNVSIIQNDAEQESVDLTDFHIYSNFSRWSSWCDLFFIKKNHPGLRIRGSQEGVNDIDFPNLYECIFKLGKCKINVFFSILHDILQNLCLECKLL